MKASAEIVGKDANSKRPASRKGSAGGLRGELKRFTRERLVAAALDSFAADGFRATTVERIVEMAGTTAPTFYRHFSSKNELLKPLQEQLTLEVRGAVGSLNDVETVDFPTMRAWLDVYARMWMRVHKLCVAYWEATELDSDLAADVIPSSLITVSELGRFLDRFAPLDRESIELRLALLIPLLDRATQVTMGTRDKRTKEKLFDEFANMLVLVLRNPGPIK